MNATSAATAMGTTIGGVKYFIMVTSSSWMNSDASAGRNKTMDRPAHNCAIEGKATRALTPILHQAVARD